MDRTGLEPVTSCVSITTSESWFSLSYEDYSVLRKTQIQLKRLNVVKYSRKSVVKSVAGHRVLQTKAIFV